MRKQIDENSIIRIQRDENTYKVIIKETIGFGGSCIVYRGLLKTKLNDIVIDRQVIIKEFYPKALDIERSDTNELLVSEDKQEQFTSLKKAFLDGQSNHSKYYEMAKDSSLPRAFIYGDANNTSYAVSDPGVGSPLTEINRENLTLSRVSLLMESLCKAFSKIHHAGYLYLDCKPDNIFFSPQNIGDKVYLFDFDTIIELSTVESNCFESCSYSLGWAAPEQLPLYENAGYSNPKQIGYHTDIFSIGTVFFWLLTGRKIDYSATESAELDRLQRDQFDWRAESSLCKKASDNVVDSINSIAKILLQPDPVARKKNVGTSISVNKIATLFGDLYGITAGDNNHFASLHTEVSKIKNDLEAIMHAVVSNDNSMKERQSAKSVSNVRVVSYQELLNLGWTSIKIAERLVENDLNLYGTPAENEGTPELWETYLSSYPETFRYLINSENEIVGNWSFLAVSEEISYRIDEGDILESEFSIDNTEFVFFPGEYFGYLLNFSINDNYNTSANYNLLIKSLSDQMITFAKQDIFFRAWYVNAFRRDHAAMYKRMGFKHQSKNIGFGDIYKLNLEYERGKITPLITKELENEYAEHFK